LEKVVRFTGKIIAGKGKKAMKLATLCYVRKDDHTLMVHRIKKQNDMHQGKWNGLGGKLEPGESPEECALREIYEESGLKVTFLELKGVLTFPAFDEIDDWYCFVYVVSAFQGELIDSSEGNLRWVPDGELLSLNLWEGDRIFLPWLDQPGVFSAKFIYEHAKLVAYQVVFYSANTVSSGTSVVLSNSR
jgi:8-oxo-dGTP diphosphatase